MISAGAGITSQSVGQALYQQIYSSFAPDVTGSQRALAIAIMVWRVRRAQQSGVGGAS